MALSILQALDRFKADLASVLSGETIVSVCHELRYRWRDRCLDPVTTVHALLIQILQSNTACCHLLSPPHLLGRSFTGASAIGGDRRDDLAQVGSRIRHHSEIEILRFAPSRTAGNRHAISSSARDGHPETNILAESTELVVVDELRRLMAQYLSDIQTCSR